MIPTHSYSLLVTACMRTGERHSIVAEVERRLSLVREVEVQVDANLKRAERLRQSILKMVFAGRLTVANEGSRAVDANTAALPSIWG